MSMKVAVIGGGIAGLSAAVALQSRGASVVVREASRRMGGCLQSERTSGGVMEWGASSLLGSHEFFGRAMDISGCSEKLREASPTAKSRHVWWAGHPCRLPTHVMDALASPLLGPLGLARVFLEPLCPRSPEGASVHSFVSRRLGRRLADRFADPFVSGVWAGDATRLRVQHTLPKLYSMEHQHRSLLIGMILHRQSRNSDPAVKPARKGLYSLEGGLQTLAEGLASRLPADAVECGKVLEDYAIGDEGVVLTYKDGSSEKIDRLVLALDGSGLARILRRHDTSLSSVLVQAPRAVVGVAHLTFKSDSSTRPRGYGMLLGSRYSRGSLLGILHVSDVFPRADGLTHLCTYWGGRRFPEVGGWNVSQLEAEASKAVGELYGLRDPVLVKGGFARPGIPQYEGGQGLLESLRDRFHGAHPRIRLVGSWQGGVSVLDVFKSAMQTMESWG
ncbi:MAG: protoporphyrinogen oxidase [Planctomycetota bacterium]